MRGPTRQIPRRALLAAVAAWPTVRASAQTTTGLTIVSGNTLAVTSLELVNALTGKHFETAGLRPELHAANTGVAAMQQLVAGRCHIARVHAIEVFKAVARQKIPLVAIGNLEHNQSFVVASAADRPVRGPADLAGKRVGVFAIGSTSDNYLDLVLRKAGLPPESVERQTIPVSPAAFAHVRHGRLDAVVLTRELAMALTHAREPQSVWSMASTIRMPGRCYVTTQDIVHSRPDLIVAFLRAMLGSVREILTGPIGPIVDRAAAGFAMPAMGTRELTLEVVASDAASWLVRGPENLLRSIPEIWREARTELYASGMAPIEDETALYTNDLIDRALVA